MASVTLTVSVGSTGTGHRRECSSPLHWTASYGRCTRTGSTSSGTCPGSPWDHSAMTWVLPEGSRMKKHAGVNHGDRREPRAGSGLKRRAAGRSGTHVYPRPYPRRFRRETVEATPIECTAPLAGCMLHFDELSASDKLSTASRSRSGLRGGIVWDVPLAGFQYYVSLRSTSTQPALAWQESARRCGLVAPTARIGAFENV